MNSGTMRIARVHGPGDVRLDEVAVPSPSGQEALIQVAACGICGSDLGYIAKGGLGGAEPLAAPLPIGHEFAGTVTAVGPDVCGLPVGTRVAINPDLAYIGGGGPDGAMAPYIRVSGARIGETVFPLPDHVSFAQAALAEPLSVALHALNVGKVQAGDKTAILGAGPIGLCAVAMLRSLGVKQIAIFDYSEARLVRARALGATLAVNVADEPMAEALARSHSGGERFGSPFVDTDVFIDCAGAPSALTDAFAKAKYRARIVIVALYTQPVSLDLWRMMANEITVSGSIADARAAEFGQALEFIAQGAFDTAPIISHSYDFADFHEALAVAADAESSAKVMLTFDQHTA